MGLYYRKHDLYPEWILIRDFTGAVSVAENIESWKYLIEEQLINNSTKGIINNVSG